MTKAPHAASQNVKTPFRTPSLGKISFVIFGGEQNARKSVRHLKGAPEASAEPLITATRGSRDERERESGGY